MLVSFIAQHVNGVSYTLIELQLFLEENGLLDAVFGDRVSRSLVDASHRNAYSLQNLLD